MFQQINIISICLPRGSDWRQHPSSIWSPHCSTPRWSFQHHQPWLNTWLCTKCVSVCLCEYICMTESVNTLAWMNTVVFFNTMVMHCFQTIMIFSSLPWVQSHRGRSTLILPLPPQKKSVIYNQQSLKDMKNSQSQNWGTNTHIHTRTDPVLDPLQAPICVLSVMSCYFLPVSMTSSSFFLTSHVLLCRSAQTWCSFPPIWWRAWEITRFSYILAVLLHWVSSGSFIHVAWISL